MGEWLSRFFASEIMVEICVVTAVLMDSASRVRYFLKS
jgi:hypothetical protein